MTGRVWAFEDLRLKSLELWYCSHLSMNCNLLDKPGLYLSLKPTMYYQYCNAFANFIVHSVIDCMIDRVLARARRTVDHSRTYEVAGLGRYKTHWQAYPTTVNSW